MLLKLNLKENPHCRRGNKSHMYVINFTIKTIFSTEKIVPFERHPLHRVPGCG